MEISEFVISTPVVATITATLTTSIINIWNTQNINKINNIKSHYSEFWKDEKIEQVRTWLANDEAYENISPILVKVNKDETITEEEYIMIDQIDKFLNMIMLIREIGYSKINLRWLMRLLNSKYGATWEELMLEYWLVAPISYKRSEFEKYIEVKYKYNFYPKFIEANNRRLKREKKKSLREMFILFRPKKQQVNSIT